MELQSVKWFTFPFLAVHIYVAAVLLYIGCMNSARIMHDGLFSNMLLWSMANFDTTPFGRILNRFSRDIDTIDNILPQVIRQWMNMLGSVKSNQRVFNDQFFSHSIGFSIFDTVKFQNFQLHDAVHIYIINQASKLHAKLAFFSLEIRFKSIIFEPWSIFQISV